MTSLEKTGINKILIQDRENIYYLSGFSYTVSGRPTGLLMIGDKSTLIIPRIAEGMAQATVRDADLSVYYEQPEGASEGVSFYAKLAKALLPGSPGGNIGVEAGRLSLSDLKFLNSLGFQVQDINGHLLHMRAVKEAEELDTIRVAGRYVDYNVQKSLASIHPGISEIEIDQRGVMALHQEVEAHHPGTDLGYFSLTVLGATRTVMPHTYSSMRKMRPDDPAVLCRQVTINGYNAQCDRVVFLGGPNQEQKKYYSLVLHAHEAGMEVIRPGILACQVDKAIREVYEKAGVSQYCVHRSGSGIGIGRQEAPYLSFNSQELIRANMALIVQPALYIPGVGGFRCTDTVIVQEGGKEIITSCPRGINALTL
ncbi:hypothetical protein DCMF_19310 [Candidatus Formimonas warabiya]|uniref:Aminopeptidase P family protein n=2 Tax=Formimonas warabiya TaxID=1761012 RepID=A0A3G1KVQ3_FORW1|nr:hypothetical protein DCMF_19310 [Candidatus Formimonas warabiya]